MEVLIRHLGIFLYLLHKKTEFEAGFSKINKLGGSTKACSWENFLKRNKKNSMFLETLEYVNSQIPTISLKHV